MCRIAYVPHLTDPEPVTVDYRYVGRVADNRDRWVIELPAGTTIEDGSIVRIDQTVVDPSAPIGEPSAPRAFRMRNAGPI